MLRWLTVFGTRRDVTMAMFKRWSRSARHENVFDTVSVDEAATPITSALDLGPRRPAFLDTLWRGDSPADRSEDLPRFSALASDDVTGFGQSPTSARSMLALRDALGASQPVVAREQFSGRQDALAQLILAIEQQRVHVVIYGERGIGKTSLAHVFAETAREARYIVLYGSCGTEGRFDDIFRTFASKIPMLYHRSVLPTTAEVEAGKHFDSLLPEGSFGPREVSDLFADVVGTRVILILDEYDRIPDPNFRRDVAELIKNLSDRAARVQLVLTGVAANLDELIGFAPSIRRNIVGLPMRPLTPVEVKAILALGEEATGLHFSDDVIAMIATMASGSPYLVRLLGHQAGLAALKQNRTQIDESHARAAVEAVLTDWNATLPRRVQGILSRHDAQAEWPVLVGAAQAGTHSDGWFGVEDIRSVLGDAVSKSEIERSLAKFAHPGELLDIDQVDGEQRFRYRYPGVASLLLMSAALARLPA